MKVNDIDYQYFQELLAKSEAFDKELLNKNRFIRVDSYSNIFVSVNETELIKEILKLNEEKNSYINAIHSYCNEKKIYFSEFMEKYGAKK